VLAGVVVFCTAPASFGFKKGSGIVRKWDAGSRTGTLARRNPLWFQRRTMAFRSLCA